MPRATKELNFTFNCINVNTSGLQWLMWRRKWQPTPVFLPGESQGRGSLVGCRLWDRTESDTTEATYSSSSQWLMASIKALGGEGNSASVHVKHPQVGINARDNFRLSISTPAPTQGGPQSTSVQFSSVAQLCPTLCNPINCSTPGLPIHHQLPEFTHTHVHQVSDAIQPSHPLSSPSPPAPNPSQHQGLFQ